MASWFASKVGGAFHSESVKREKGLSREARLLVEQAFQGFDLDNPVIDYHTHLVGKGTGSTGCFVHQDTVNTWRHPVKAMKFKMVESAAGITDVTKWDAQYVDRLVSLIQDIKPYAWGRHYLLALDQYYDPEGHAVAHNTGLYVPNDYMFEIAQKYPDQFMPCVSIHPYRKDAIQELQKWIDLGVRMVKWLPNSQGIDPSDRRCKEFYSTMAANGMILLSHCGNENFLDPPGTDNNLGNPLLLRSALNQGVKVIVAHCASEGKSLDLDQLIPHPLTNNVDLFLRMMGEAQYDGLLFGDISGITAFGRIDELINILDHPELHTRLVYGSDYPMPAVNLVVQTYWFANRGLITEDESAWLGEIYKHNPLLFDFVLKRTLRVPKTGNKFDLRVFKENHRLRLPTKPSSPRSSQETEKLDNGASLPSPHGNSTASLPKTNESYEGTAVASTTSASELGDLVEEEIDDSSDFDANVKLNHHQGFEDDDIVEEVAL